jgi:hypothetical protein
VSNGAVYPPNLDLWDLPMPSRDVPCQLALSSQSIEMFCDLKKAPGSSATKAWTVGSKSGTCIAVEAKGRNAHQERTSIRFLLFSKSAGCLRGHVLTAQGTVRDLVRDEIFGQVIEPTPKDKLIRAGQGCSAETRSWHRGQYPTTRRARQRVTSQNWYLPA